MEEIRDLVRELKNHWKERNLPVVISTADLILKIEPHNPDAQKLYLRAALAKSDWPTAAKLAYDVAPHAPALVLTVVRKLAKEGDLVGSAQLLLKLRLQQHESDEALKKEIEQLSDLHGMALLKGGTKASLDGDSALAEKMWCLGAQIAPSNSVLRKKVADLRKTAVDQAKAIDPKSEPAGFIQAWERVLAIDPHHVTAAKRLAVAADNSGDDSRSINGWKRVLKIDPANDAAPTRLARAAMRSKREYEALYFLQSLGLVRAEDPLIAKLRIKVSQACRKALVANDVANCADHLLLLKQTDHSPANAKKGDEFHNLRVAVVRKLISQMKMARKSNDGVQAADMARRLLDFDERNELALSILARQAMKLHHFGDAANFYERLIDVKPDFLNAREHLERARARLERHTENTMLRP